MARCCVLAPHAAAAPRSSIHVAAAAQLRMHFLPPPPCIPSTPHTNLPHTHQQPPTLPPPPAQPRTRAEGK